MLLKIPPGIDIFYRTYGHNQNIPIVLVHGFGADHQMWKPQIEEYPGKGFFVIVLDVRGHGRSTKVSAFEYEDCANDIKLLLDHLGIKTTSLVGVSMGGNIVQQFACDFPDRVEKLVIADSFSGSSTRKEKINAWLASFALRFMPRRFLAKGFELQYKKIGREDVGSYFSHQLEKVDMSQLRHIRAKVNQFSITDRLGEINAPTLVLTGDQFGKWFVATGRKTASGIKNSTFKVLEGGADPSNLIVPEMFDAEVISFINNM